MNDIISLRDYLKTKIGDDVEVIGKDLVPTQQGAGFLTISNGKLTHVLDEGFVVRTVNPKGISADCFIPYGGYSQVVFPSAIRSASGIIS